MDIYSEIAKRTNGNIYLGVVGPVRTGKSTFIKRFMEKLVLPVLDDSVKRRAIDELPQSSAGKMIMTTEPKFVPEEAVEVKLENGCQFKTRLIDCVGYVVKDAQGYLNGETPRLVESPWSDEPIAFEKAAEIGTRKVIFDHATVGVVITTDGSVADLSRESYIDAEEQVVQEMKATGKPFVILLNSKTPNDSLTQELRKQLEAKYAVPVISMSCFDMEKEDIDQILSAMLKRFPVKEVAVCMPGWINSLSEDHWLKSQVFQALLTTYESLNYIEQAQDRTADLQLCPQIESADVILSDLSTGRIKVSVRLADHLLYQIIAETTGIELSGEGQLLPMIWELAACKKEYDKIKNALDEVEATGYGIVMPTLDELTLEEPEIVKQGSRYGVKLRASAPSIHLMRANITTEVSPIVGSEQQSEELVMYLLKEFEESPIKIWQSNIFGKSLHELVNEGLRNKLYRMPVEARSKIGETLERVINEGCSGLICIII